MKCSKGVFGAGQACQAMGNLYHDACFTCAACSKCVCVGVWGKDHGDREGEAREEHLSWRRLALGPPWFHRKAGQCPLEHLTQGLSG